MNDAWTDFDFALENAAAQAKKGLMRGFAVFSGVFALLWVWIGIGALYLFLLLFSTVLYDIADSRQELSKSEFDFAYGVRTN